MSNNVIDRKSNPVSVAGSFFWLLIGMAIALASYIAVKGVDEWTDIAENSGMPYLAPAPVYKEYVLDLRRTPAVETTTSTKTLDEAVAKLKSAPKEDLKILQLRVYLREYYLLREIKLASKRMMLDNLLESYAINQAESSKYNTAKVIYRDGSVKHFKAANHVPIRHPEDLIVVDVVDKFKDS